MYTLALSDTAFDERELEKILEIGTEKGISKEDFEAIILNPTSVKMSYPTEFIPKIEFLYDFTRIIWSDEKVEAEEIKQFLKFCDRFGFQEEEGKQLFDWLLELSKRDLPSAQIGAEIEKFSSNNPK